MADTTSPYSKEQKAIDCERLAVLVTGDGIEKILGIPKLFDGTGKTQAETINSLINHWDIFQNIVAMGFDTTASNTGE
jgi:hypothetical protein